MPQPLDRIALHQPHRAGVEIRPDGFGPILFFGLAQLFGHQVKRCFPACLLPGAFALGTGAHQRLHQPVGMVDALGIARHLGADNAVGVAVVLGARQPADPPVRQDLDIEGAGRRTVVRTGRMSDSDICGRVHADLTSAISSGGVGTSMPVGLTQLPPRTLPDRGGRP